MKPLLAATLDDPAALDWSRPRLVSAKLDGFRAIVQNGVVLSRSLKPIPNRHVQSLFGHLEHYDGELIVGSPTDPRCLGKTAAVMSEEGEPNVSFWIFDHVECPSLPYRQRLKKLKHAKHTFKHEQCVVTCADTLLKLETKMLDIGYEGLIVRDPEGIYKFGRSTLREGYLLKLKRFTDGEFEVIGFEERMANNNEAATNELGRTKRSSHQANKEGRGDLGALVLKYKDGLSFNCGTGFSDDERAEIWNNQDKCLGKLAKIKYFAYGMKDVPKLISFLGWRNPIDL